MIGFLGAVYLKIRDVSVLRALKKAIGTKWDVNIHETLRTALLRKIDESNDIVKDFRNAVREVHDAIWKSRQL